MKALYFLLIALPLLMGCSFQIINYYYEPKEVEKVEVKPIVKEVKKKSNYQTIKEKELQQWDNLPLPQDHKEQLKNQ